MGVESGMVLNLNLTPIINRFRNKESPFMMTDKREISKHDRYKIDRYRMGRTV